MYLLSQISVPQPIEINFTCPPFIFGTCSLILFAPRPPLGSLGVVYSGTYLTSSLNWIDAFYATYSRRILLASSSAFATLVSLYFYLELFFPRFVSFTAYSILFLFFTCILLTVYVLPEFCIFKLFYTFSVLLYLYYYLYCIIIFLIVYCIFLALRYSTA